MTLVGAGCRAPAMLAEPTGDDGAEPLRVMPELRWREGGGPLRYEVSDGRAIDVAFQLQEAPPNRVGGGSKVRYVASFRDSPEAPQLECEVGRARDDGSSWTMSCTRAGRDPLRFELGACGALARRAHCEGVLDEADAQHRVGFYFGYADDALDEVLWTTTWHHEDGSLLQAAQVHRFAPLGLWVKQAVGDHVDRDALLLHAVIFEAMQVDLHTA